MYTLKGIGFSNYRSVGEKPVFLYPFSKINLFVGPNNTGKSNILSFIYRWATKRLDFDEIDYHNYNIGKKLAVFYPFTEEEIYKFNSTKTSYTDTLSSLCNILTSDFFYYDRKKKVSWFDSNPIDSIPRKFLDNISPLDLCQLASDLTQSCNQYDNQENASYIYNALFSKEIERNDYLKAHNSVYIHAERDLYDHSKNSFLDGDTIINRLSHIVNNRPGDMVSATKKTNLEKFISDLMGKEIILSVLPDNEDITIKEVSDREGITQRGLKQLGSGIHEIIYFAIVATLCEDAIICIDEPEIHMHPRLQRKFLKYLLENSSNQYFIATHSSSFINTENNEVSVFGVSMNKENCTECHFIANEQELFYLTDLIGVKASDIIQCNCVIWVEGPSDRIYVNYWIHGMAPKLQEGVDYSIMFYGGRLASHLSGNDEDDDNNFIHLLNINRHSFIIIDSDKKSEDAEINDTKNRLKSEFTDNCWITEGREIENYLNNSQYEEIALKMKDDFTIKNSKYENRLAYSNGCLDKVKFAEEYVAKSSEPDYSIMDLKERVSNLIDFIKDSNT